MKHMDDNIGSKYKRNHLSRQKQRNNDSQGNSEGTTKKQQMKNKGTVE